MLLPQNSVGLIRSGKDCFDIPLYVYDHDFFPNTKTFHAAETFTIFIRPTCVFSTLLSHLYLRAFILRYSYFISFICASYLQISPNSYSPFTMGTGSFARVKRPGRGADHPLPSKRRGHERVGLYLYLPSSTQWRVTGRTPYSPFKTL